MTVAIRYVDGPRLTRSLLAAADWVAAGRDEINRINVFPVPDGDTGTNFSLTLRSVADALRALGDAPLAVTAQTAARGAVLGARGNSGMMLAHFLLGFAEVMGDKEQATARDIAEAFRRGAHRLYRIPWTTLAKAPSSPSRAKPRSPPAGPPPTPPTSRVFMTRLLNEGEVALAHTPELLAVLKEAGVVDAGGMGFVRMIEGRRPLYRRGPDSPPAPLSPVANAPVPAALIEVAAERDFQYLHRGDGPGRATAGRQRCTGYIRNFGGVRTGRTRSRSISEDPCAHGHPGCRLYLRGPLGKDRSDQGRGHAGPASQAGPWRPSPGGDRGRLLGRPARRACWTGITSRWCRCR